jgi:hypothetical protein
MEFVVTFVVTFVQTVYLSVCPSVCLPPKRIVCRVIFMQTAPQLLKHILPSTRLLIQTRERTNLQLHVQVFQRMNTWIFKTC